MIDTPDQHFFSWFRDEMRTQGLSIRDCAGHLGLSYFTVLHWTSGRRRPHEGQAERLANLFRISSETILNVLAQDSSAQVPAGSNGPDQVEAPFSAAIDAPECPQQTPAKAPGLAAGTGGILHNSA